MGKLFGTDGIRGVAGLPPLDAGTVSRIGTALALFLKQVRPRPHVLIGRDTRESGPWISRLLQAALRQAGCSAASLGVISTPAVSYLTTQTGADAGIVISASHNPYQDNGIKIFSSSGMKFPDAVEDALEQSVLAGGGPAREPACPDAAEPAERPESLELYARHLLDSVRPGFRFEGMKLVVDCAHGAVSAIAPGIFSALGAEVRAIHCSPDGRNINLDAGALHPGRLRDEVLRQEADAGVAFDGDADRAIFIDRGGRVRDGDDVLYLLANHLLPEGAPRLVVGTVMANLGLEVALEEAGIRLVRASVGDRYVLEEMIRLGAVIGGEQSGHVIILRLARTGDGLLTALKVFEVLRDQRREFSDLCGPLKRFPQQLRNVRVGERKPLEEIPGLRAAESSWKQKLGRRSRILLRYSGTENLARIMVEGENEAAVAEAADELAGIWADSH